MLLNFLVYITIPVVLQYTGIVLAIGSFVIYVGAIVGLATPEEYFWPEVREKLFSSRFSEIIIYCVGNNFLQGSKINEQKLKNTTRSSN